MISYQEAKHIVLSEAKSFGTEIISIDDAEGRFLTEDIFADRDYPPFNRSAMDGYAIKYEDWQNGVRKYKIQEVIYAGNITSEILESGAAFKIMTGAAVPFPANTVIRREDSVENEGHVSFNIDSLKELQNIAKKGEDLQKGCLAITKYSICTAVLIGTLATLGKSKIKVEALPKVALFTTGNEVKALNETLSEVEIRNSNYYMLKSLLKSWKIVPSFNKHISDNKTELETTIAHALNVDIIVLSGGVSAGDADYVPEVLAKLGVNKLFHKVSIKPGKPIWCGKMPDGPIVFALPGNPFSSFVTFKLFIELFLDKSLSKKTKPLYQSTFKGTRSRKSTLDEFFPAKFTDLGTKLEATSLNGSGDIRLGIDADVLIVHPKDEDGLSDGQLVNYYRF